MIWNIMWYDTIWWRMDKMDIEDINMHILIFFEYYQN